MKNTRAAEIFKEKS